MGDKSLPNIASYSNQNHFLPKQYWHKDVKSWLNHWGVEEEVTLQKNINIKSIVTSKFKKNMWCDKELKDKRKNILYKGDQP